MAELVGGVPRGGGGGGWMWVEGELMVGERLGRGGNACGGVNLIWLICRDVKGNVPG